MSKKKTGTSFAPSQEWFEQLARWNRASKELEEAKKEESELREYLTKNAFPKLEEGVNRVFFEAPDGQPYELVANCQMTRKLDALSLDAVFAQLPPTSDARIVGNVVEYEPKLVNKGFKALPEEERRIVSQCLTEKLGAPQLSLNPFTPAHDPATTPPVPDLPAMPLPIATIVVNGIHYAPHPARFELGAWVGAVKANPPPGTVSFDVAEAGENGFRVTWNGVPVDPLTGEACQRLDTPNMDAYFKAKEAEIEKAKAFVQNAPIATTPPPATGAIQPAEAELPPGPTKKRGRKPGSKNKPKA